MLALLAALIPACSLAGRPAQAPEMPVGAVRVAATTDTALCPATPTDAAGSASSLRAGQVGGYAEDGHLLIRFDNLPETAARDILQVRLGLFRQWRGNSHDDGDEIVKLVVPAPRPFDEAGETWTTAAGQPEPNNTIRDFQAATRLAGVPSSHLVLSANPMGTGQYKYTDVTEIARGWFAGTRTNHGLLLITDFDRSRPWVGTAHVTSREGPEDQRPVRRSPSPSDPHRCREDAGPSWRPRGRPKRSRPPPPNCVTTCGAFAASGSTSSLRRLSRVAGP